MADILLIIGILLSRDTSYHLLAPQPTEKFMARHGLDWLWAYLVGAHDPDHQPGRWVAAGIISSAHLFAYLLDFWVLAFWVGCAVATSVYWQFTYRRWSKKLDAALAGDQEAQEYLNNMGMGVVPNDVDEEHIDAFLELLEQQIKKHQDAKEEQ